MGCSLGEVRASEHSPGSRHLPVLYRWPRVTAPAVGAAYDAVQYFKKQDRLKSVITVSKYPQSQTPACWYTRTRVKLSEDHLVLAGKFPALILVLIYTGEQRCMLHWKVEETGSFLHGVHSTSVRARALSWKRQLDIVLVQRCSVTNRSV